jgi:hypothetical protein
VCCYLIVQMVGAGQLIKLLFGLDYPVAVVIVGALMLVYDLRRHDRHHRRSSRPCCCWPVAPPSR